MKHFSTAIKKRGWLRIGAALLIIAGLLAAVLPASQAPAVASNQFQDEPVELCGGQCAHKTITFETGDLRIDKVDVVFLIDASGSMDDEIDEVQNQSLEIMDMLRELVSDSAFGAASFVDYNGFVDSQYGETYGSEDDYPYRLGQDITEDTGDLQDALNGIALEYGNDSPESYSRALWEMQFLNWREDSKRIVILFGDAYPHDRTFFGEDFGVDPGPDETEGTEDDLVFAEVVQDLIDARISVVGVNSGYDSDNAVAFFQHVAEQTGGLYFPLYNADEIPDAVAQSVEEEISTIDRLTVRATRGYEDWIASAPEAYTDVGSHETNSFEVDICPAAGRAEAGTHEFELIIDGDGTVLESIPVVVDYTRRCTTGPQVYIADSDDDDGSVCSEGPFWQSPDLINRTDDDGIHHHQNPVRGQTNYLYARVHNIGDRDAREVRISLYWANPAIGLWYPDHWNRIGSTTVDVVDVGQEIWTEGIPWNPPGAPGEDHLCALARIESDEDPILREGDVPCDNNIAQRNLHVLDLDPDQPETSDKMSFRVIAPPDEHMGVIDIVVIIPHAPTGTKVWVILPPSLLARWQRAGGELEGGSIDEGGRVLADPGARETVLRDVPLEAGAEVEVEMEIEAPVDKETDPFSVTVVERVDGQDVGGNTYYYAPPRPPALSELPDQVLGFIKENPALAGGLCCAILLVGIGGGAVVLAVRRRGRGRPYSPPAQPRGKACPRCGASMAVEFAFCPQCGSEVIEGAPPAPAQSRQCPNCGADTKEGAQFCTQCGTGLQA